VDPAGVAAFRLSRQHLTRRRDPSALAAVVSGVGGVQSQVPAMAAIALWARTRGLKASHMEAALSKRRTIVKTWSLRHTLHLHAASDFQTVLAALLPARLHRETRWIERSGLRERETTALVMEALRGGPLTRAQLAERLAPHLGEVAKQWVDEGWGNRTEGAANAWYLVQPAMARGLAVVAPARGQGMSFARTDEWLQGAGGMPEPEAAEEALVRRYLAAYGPADARDIRAWSSLQHRRLAPVLARMEDELVEVASGGRSGFLLRRDVRALESARLPGEVVRLLPSFDPLLLGHDRREHIVDDRHYDEVYKKAGWLAPVVLVDGRVAGVWRYLRGTQALTVAVRPFGRMSRATREAVEEEAADLARFTGRERADVAFGS
jgi:hypothetical protein